MIDYSATKSYVVNLEKGRIGVWLDRTKFYVYKAVGKALEAKNESDGKGGLSVHGAGNVPLAWKIALDALNIPSGEEN